MMAVSITILIGASGETAAASGGGGSGGFSTERGERAAQAADMIASATNTITRVAFIWNGIS
jgi:hypothetical protein